MKKLLIPHVFCLCAYSAALADTTEFTVGSYGDIYVNGAWTGGNWSNGVPTDTSDVIFSGHWGRMLGDYNVTVNSIQFNSGFGVLTLTGEQEQNPPGSAYESPQLNITQNVIVNFSSGLIADTGDYGTFAYFGSGPNQGYGMKQINIGGNIEFDNNGALGFSYDPNVAYSRTNYSADIAGVVNFNSYTTTEADVRLNLKLSNKWVLNDSTMATDAYVRVSGINGVGSMQTRSSADGMTTTLVFEAQEGNTFTGGEWGGYLDKQVRGTDPKSNTFNFVMNGGADGGKQILRLDNVDYYWNHPMNEINLTVESGKIDVSTANNNVRFTSIKLEGGNLGVARVFDITTSAKYKDEAGQILAQSFEWNDSGTLHMEIYNGKSSILITQTIDLIGEDFKIIIDSYDAISELLTYEFMQFDSGQLTESDLAKIYIATADGLYEVQNLSIQNENTLVGSFTQIPEPAAIAIVLGALALAFAAYRRRK